MKLKVMTWNVENLFRPGEGSGGPESDDIYQAKLQLLAQTITKLDSDVLAIQEIGSVEAFQDLKTAVGNAYANGQLSKNPDDRGIRVGFLSKLSLENPTDIVDFSPNVSLSIKGEDGTPIARMRRGALWVKTTVDGLTINVITAHLKSKLLTFPGGAFSTRDENLRARVASLALAERTEEAVTLRTTANEIIWKNKTEALIVLGDLNDVPEAASTQILQGPEGSQPGHGKGFDQPDQGDDVRLFNLAGSIPLDHRYSRINNGVQELIDQIFVSEELVPYDQATKTRTVPTVDSHPELQGGIESVGPNPNARKNKPASDHAPVTATFDF